MSAREITEIARSEFDAWRARGHTALAARCCAALVLSGTFTQEQLTAAARETASESIGAVVVRRALARK